MINSLSNTKEIDKIIRNELVTQSGLDASFIRNALSEYGTYLDKNRIDSIFESISPSDCCILFEVQSSDNEHDVSFTEVDDSVTYYKSFSVQITMYGDETDNIAPLLVARLRTEAARDNLFNQGVYLESVSNPTQLDEFKNGVLWKRWDFEINISVRFSIAPVYAQNPMKILNDLTIENI